MTLAAPGIGWSAWSVLGLSRRREDRTGSELALPNRPKDARERGVRVYAGADARDWCGESPASGADTALPTLAGDNIVDLFGLKHEELCLSWAPEILDVEP